MTNEITGVLVSLKFLFSTVNIPITYNGINSPKNVTLYLKVISISGDKEVKKT